MNRAAPNPASGVRGPAFSVDTAARRDDVRSGVSPGLGVSPPSKNLRAAGAGPAGVPVYLWHWRARLPERKGQPCEVLARGSMNSILVRFADGFRVVTSRYAVRRPSLARRTTGRRGA